MSRTIRNRTPSNGLNDYAFHKRKDALERWRKPGDTDHQAIDNFLTFYRRDGYCMRRNRIYKDAKCRSQKQGFKQAIHHALKDDSFDNMTNKLCFKSVRSRYW